MARWLFLLRIWSISRNKGLINADVLTATNDNCVQDFANGKAAMFSNGMWALSSVLEANPDMADKIGFAPYPAYMPNSKPVVLSAEDSGYCISATTEHKEECIEFLNFLFSPENQKKYSEVAKAPSAFTDVDAEWAPENVVKEVNAALKSAANIGFTNEKPAGFSGDDAGRMVQELLAGQYTPTEFASGALPNANRTVVFISEIARLSLKKSTKFFRPINSACP